MTAFHPTRPFTIGRAAGVDPKPTFPVTEMR
jgi:hypothetical protein